MINCEVKVNDGFVVGHRVANNGPYDGNVGAVDDLGLFVSIVVIDYGFLE